MQSINGARGSATTARRSFLWIRILAVCVFAAAAVCGLAERAVENSQIDNTTRVAYTGEFGMEESRGAAVFRAPDSGLPDKRLKEIDLSKEREEEEEPKQELHDGGDLALYISLAIVGIGILTAGIFLFVKREKE